MRVPSAPRSKSGDLGHGSDGNVRKEERNLLLRGWMDMRADMDGESCDSEDKDKMGQAGFDLHYKGEE